MAFSIEGSTSDELKILLVEDSRGDATAFRRAMARINPAVSVTVASSAEEAISLFERGADFGLCLFDINLPKLNGLELLARVKPWRQSLPMMMLSSSESASEISTAFSRGADGYVVKPFDFGGFDDIARYLCDLWFEGTPSQHAGKANVILPNAA